MILWIVLTVMCSVAVVLVTVPLVRRYENYKDMASAGTSIFTDQLREVERDRGLGVIGEKEADLAKIEIERRLIAAAKNVTEPKPISQMWRNVALAAVVGFVVLGSVNIYMLRGSPDKTQPPPSAPATNAAQTQVPESAAKPATTAASEVDTMIGKLAKRLEQNPQDADGWRMLGWSYFNTQRYEESAAAYAKAMAIDPTSLDYKAGYAEALVQSAQGMVTPKAQEIFADVLKSDPKELRARFYTALAREQAGDLSTALDGWLSLLAEAPADAGWVPDVKNRVADLAKKTGRDVTAALTSAPATEAPAAGGAASPEQQATIDGMISKLAAKLEANPRDRDGWAMMIRSLKVKGDMAGASAALKKAIEVFADDPATSGQITEMAKSLGVTADASAAAPAASAPVITEEDVAAVKALPADDQQAMIRGMVDNLAAKLAQSPRDSEGWLRLIRSRMVLNQPDLAKEALKKAVAEFSNDAAVSNQIVTAARQLGVVLE